MAAEVKYNISDSILGILELSRLGISEDHKTHVIGNLSQVMLQRIDQGWPSSGSDRVILLQQANIDYQIYGRGDTMLRRPTDIDMLTDAPLD